MAGGEAPAAVLSPGPPWLAGKTQRMSPVKALPGWPVLRPMPTKEARGASMKPMFIIGAL